MAEQENSNFPPDVELASEEKIELVESEDDQAQNPDFKTESPSSYDSPQNDLVGTVIEDKYEVLSLIGKGGLGMVFKARHTITNTTVALKVLLPGKHLDKANIARFKREAKTAMVLKHQNIAGVQDIGFHESMPYIVMEYVEGRSLYDLLKAQRLSTPDKVTILKDICQAMEYARTNDVVHRDLKPDNIIVSKNKEGIIKTKVVDFGIAKVLDADEEVTLTKTGDIFGTPLYMSPEQINGKTIDHQSDLYSIGCIAYEFFAGKTPFHSDTALGILNAHINDEAPKLVPPQELKGIELVIVKCLSKDKKHRYKTAKNLLDEIERIEKGDKPLATNLPISKKTTKRILIACILSCFVFLVGLLTFIEVFKPDTVVSLSEKIRANPEDVFSLIERGRLYSVDGQYQNAISDYNKAIKFAGNDKSNLSIAYIRKGLAQEQLNQVEAALQSINKGIEIKPSSYRGYMERASVLRRLNRDAEAISDYKKSIELNNVAGQQQMNKNFVWARISEIHADNENWQKSIEAANKSLDGSVQIELALLSKARSYAGMEQYKNCVQACTKVLDQNPKSKLALSIRGTAYGDLKEYQKALADFEEWISVAPNDPHAFVKRAGIHRKMNNLKAAKSDIYKAFRLEADFYEAYLEKAKLKLAEKKYPEALDSINKAITKSPTKEALKIKSEITSFMQ